MKKRSAQKNSAAAVTIWNAGHIIRPESGSAINRFSKSPNACRRFRGMSASTSLSYMVKENDYVRK
ncbi:MAG: hypothetical protein MJ062_07250 [Oscillospiraceae bacterium]|nr:hypothetical protein [Oscillospiraceae bacterium]